MNRRRIAIATAALLGLSLVAFWPFSVPSSALSSPAPGAPRPNVEPVARPAPAVERDSASGGLFDDEAKAAFLRGLTPDEQERVIRLKSRYILPAKSYARSAEGGQAFVQFDEHPSDDAKADWAKQGVHLGAPYTGRSYRATLEPGAWDRVKDRPEVVGIAEVRPEDKLPPVLHRWLQQGAAAQPATAQRRERVAIELAPGAGEDIVAVLARMGLDIERRVAKGDLLVQANPAQIAQLAEMRQVAYIHHRLRLPLVELSDDWARPALPPPEKHNEDSRALHRVDALHGPLYDLTGTGVRICEIDGGPVRATHEAFGGRVTLVETDQPLSNHATHVGCTMIGNPAGVPRAKGMAPSATLYSYDFYDEFNGSGDWLLQEKVTHSVATYACATSNHSYGYPIGADGAGVSTREDWFGYYDYDDGLWDQLVADQDVIVCKSAGNDRNDSAAPGYYDDGYGLFYYDGHDGRRVSTDLVNPYWDCIPLGNLGKNIITVGAVGPDGVLLDFSSTGPVDDGRVKPDVVADGYLYSAFSSSDTAYGTMQGTSMACPTTTGITAVAA